MNQVTYTPYKKHFEVYIEILRPIAVNSCQTELVIKYNITI